MLMLIPRPDSKIFYGWYVVAVAFAANFLSVGTGFYILNAFMDPLCHANGWSRTDVNFALSTGMFFGYLVQFLYGTVVEKIGPRLLMVIGPFFAGIMFIGIGHVTALWEFYIIFVLLYLGNNAYGGIVANTAVSNWFILKRGQAMGFAASAISFSGAVVPLVAMSMVFAIGMKWTTLIIGLFMMLLGPIAWFIVRDWPETYGLLPDGLSGIGNAEEEGQGEELDAADLLPNQFPDFEGAEWKFKDLVRAPAFWKMGFAYVLTLAGVMGVMSQLQPRFADEGFSAMKAMVLMAITAFIGAVGKYVWGSLCDRFEPRRVISLLMSGAGIGLSLSLIKDCLPAMYGFMALFGFCMGGVMSTYPILTGYLFGRRAFASVLKYLMLFLTLPLIGPIAAGVSYDLTGSYDSAYALYAVMAFGGSALVLTIKRPVPQA
ncbi:MFS transporter [Desulfatibacillum aliphaticivorans]|uniref:MFS transporter n=1 Tax=Desulfatibacillum aliphaticivorans TaxID=218208 RepID=UPI00041AE221|nr:MFS transporter [Desulfatibacillum aliphaticivorans]